MPLEILGFVPIALQCCALELVGPKSNGSPHRATASCMPPPTCLAMEHQEGIQRLPPEASALTRTINIQKRLPCTSAWPMEPGVTDCRRSSPSTSMTEPAESQSRVRDHAASPVIP